MDYSKENNSKQRKENKSPTNKIKNKTGIIAFRVVLAAILVAGFGTAGAIVGAYFGILKNAPELSTPEILPNIYSSSIVDQNMQEIERLTAEENREYVGSEKIPQTLKDAFVAIEDERFYEHNGIDLKGMLRALYVNITDPNRNEGASTLTQQLIKNNFTKITRNTLETKLQEQYLAIKYERLLSDTLHSKAKVKDYILEVYLNTIALGHNLNGVQTATNYYFDKDVSELTLSESAVIAAITQNPSRYMPDRKPDENKKRQTLVLNKMLELNMITESEHRSALADDVYTRISESEQVLAETSYHSYFNDYLIQEVVRDLQDKYHYSEKEAYNYFYNAGLQIVSTQDLEIQQVMDDSFNNDDLFPKKDFSIDIQYYLSVKNKISGKIKHLNKKGNVSSMDEVDAFVDKARDELLTANDEILPDGERVIPIPQPQAAMVIMDYHTGYVKAISGGRGEKMVNLALNRATDSERQPGSVFKVLASYAPALDMGRITATTVIDDVPLITGDKHQFKNWYNGYRGLSTVREGIINSMNVITVKNMIDTGVDDCFNYLLNFGFTTLIDKVDDKGRTDRNPSTALGGITYGVKQVEVTAAYGAIANLGQYNKPVVYTKVLDHDGNPILENPVEPNQVLKKTSAYILTDMMKDVVTSGTGGKARFKSVKMPLAGKTGTTSDNKDLTFVGYTPYYAAGIWLGFDQPKMMVDTGNYHMILWSDIMEKIHAELPFKEFDEPEGLVRASVCKESGKLAVSGMCSLDPRGSTIRSEIFAAGTQPTESCNVHVSMAIDTMSNMKATPYCPSEYIQMRSGIVRPIPYTGSTPVEDRIYEIRAAAGECTLHSYGGTQMLENEDGDETEGEFDESFGDIPNMVGGGYDNEEESQPVMDDPFDIRSSVLPSQTPRPRQTPTPTAPPVTNTEATPKPTAPAAPIVTPAPVPAYTPKPNNFTNPSDPFMDDQGSADNFSY